MKLKPNAITINNESTISWTLTNVMAVPSSFLRVGVQQSIDCRYLEWQYECIYSGRGRPATNNGCLSTPSPPQG